MSNNICGTCNGSKTVNCLGCNGEGKVETNQPSEGVETRIASCAGCNGSGRRTCHSCGGTGER